MAGSVIRGVSLTIALFSIQWEEPGVYLSVHLSWLAFDMYVALGKRNFNAAFPKFAIDLLV